MASITDAVDFELSKENILPIQQGRKANVLKSALATQPEDNLLQQRRSYEKQLRLYSGDDPLSVWYSYIKWVEQNYPKGGRDGNICKLIQQCLLNLKDEVKYHNDDRFIDIWVKFANLSNRPHEVYTNMYSRGVGCYSSRFYISWAWEVEQSGDVKRAEEILLEGLRRNAQPLETLKSTHAEVQMRLAKSFILDDDKDMCETDHRTVFAALKTQAKNKAPISRVGDAVIPMNNQQMVVNQQKGLTKQPQVRMPFKIYSADNEISSLPIQNKKSTGFSVHSSGTKENEKKLSKWSKVKVHQTSHIAPKLPEFTVHCDNTPQPESATKLPQSTKALTIQSEPWKPAVALFEKYNPMVRPMYDKAKVYGGAEEFSFEEIRAAKWYEQRKRIEKEQKRLQKEQEMEQKQKQEQQEKEQKRIQEEQEMEQKRIQEQQEIEQKRIQEEQEMEQKRIKEEQEMEQKRIQEEQEMEQKRVQEEQEMKQKRIQEEQEKEQKRLQEENEQKRLQEELEKEYLKEQVKKLQEKMQLLEASVSQEDNKQIVASVRHIKTDLQELPTFSEENEFKYLDNVIHSNSYISSLVSPFLPEQNSNDSCSKESEIVRQRLNILDIEPMTKENGTLNEAIKLKKLLSQKERNAVTELSPVPISAINSVIENKIRTTSANDFIDHPHSSSKFHENLDVTSKQFGNTYIANEVNCMMHELYNETIGHNAKLDDLSFNINLEKNNYNFTFDGKDPVFSSETKLQMDYPKLESDEQKQPKAFSIFQDPTEILASKSNISSFPVFQNDQIKENDIIKPSECAKTDLPYTDNIDLKNVEIFPKVTEKGFEPFEKDLENIENIPPPDYVQNTEHRELSGILQPSKNVFFIPLEQQLQEDSDEEINSGGFNDMRPLDENLTLLTAEQFAAAACFMSTPCVKPQPIGVRDMIKVDSNIPQTVPEDNLEKISLTQMLTDAISFADSEKVRQLLMQVLFNVTKRKAAPVLKETYSSVIEHLKLCCVIASSEKLKQIVQNCVAYIEANVEKNKDFNQTNITLQNHTLQLSTIMETSRESKSSSSSNSMVSMKQKSIQNSHLCSISKLARMPIAEIHEDSETAANSELYSEGKTEELEAVTKNETCIIDYDNLDPFDSELTTKLLKSLSIPIFQRENFYDYRDTLFEIKAGSCINLGKSECLVSHLHAEGAYAKVYSAQYIGNSFIDFNEMYVPPSKLAIKVCKEANEWEFYICSELSHRLSNEDILPNIKESVMEIKSAAAYKNNLVIISDLYENGTLLDIVNMFKRQNTRIPEYLVMFFALEMLHIVSGLHKCGVIHGDIKPDNFILNKIPGPNEIESMLSEPHCLRLIDFGRAIDLKLFKPGVTFSVVVKTDGFQCVQMKEGQPWVFETDWYGVLGCIHVLLFNEYMNVRKNSNNQWEPVQKFKRYFQTDIWQPLFQALLNIPSGYEIPDLTPYIALLTEKLQKQMKTFKMQLLQLKLAFGKQLTTTR